MPVGGGGSRASILAPSGLRGAVVTFAVNSAVGSGGRQSKPVNSIRGATRWRVVDWLTLRDLPRKGWLEILSPGASASSATAARR